MLRISIVIGGLAILLTGCNSLHTASSPRTISSKPPFSAIELEAPATVSGEEGAISTFPKGKYKPAYEDDHGYYFEAPSKVLVDDVGVYGFDGGVYILRGETTPTEWYIIRPNGRRSTGHFKTPPICKVIP